MKAREQLPSPDARPHRTSPQIDHQTSDDWRSTLSRQVRRRASMDTADVAAAARGVAAQQEQMQLIASAVEGAEDAMGAHHRTHHRTYHRKHHRTQPRSGRDPATATAHEH